MGLEYVETQKLLVEKIEVNKKFLENIERKGILNPIVVEEVEIGKERRYLVVDGRRRANACIQLGLEKIPAHILPRQEQQQEQEREKERLIESLSANWLRAENPAQEAKAIKKLIDMGLTKSEIAKLCGKTASHITKRMRLFNLIPEIFALLERMEIPVSVARELAKLTEDEQYEYYTNPESKWTVKDVTQFVRSKKISKTVSSIDFNQVNSFLSKVKNKKENRKQKSEIFKKIEKIKQKIKDDELRRELEELEKELSGELV